MSAARPVTFFAPSSCVGDAPTRTTIIKELVPQASAAVDRIEETTRDLKFGSPIKAVLNNYHFPTDAAIREYFRVYLSQGQSDDEIGGIDAGLLNSYVAKTINRRERNAVENEFTTDRAFQAISDELERQIDAATEERIPLVKLLIGPTGAGKTAFSKSLFNVCLTRFWKARIIPSRVEFSKYREGLRISTNASDYQLDAAFFSFVKRCQCRDLLIYLFMSGVLDDAAKRSAITEVAADSLIERELVLLLDKTKDVIFDGDKHCLTIKTRDLFVTAVGRMGEDLDQILYKLSNILKVRFLVSFDGFDSTRLEHFLFEKRESSPIFYLVRTLKGLHEKVQHAHLSRYPLETHYLTYLRDTTFARLKTELFRKVGGAASYPIQWIVPPSYQQLVQNAAVYLTRSHEPSDNLADVLSSDVVAAFDRAVFDNKDLNASTHLPFVFGSSGRRMKSHIRQLMISALYRAVTGGDRDLLRLSSGVDAKTVWLELVRHHGVRALPHYVILQDLFLNETRQLTPKLEVDPGVVTAKLNAGDFDGLLDHIIDLDETSGTFGCLFNYFYQWYITSKDQERQPGMLLLVRILQYIEKNPQCLAGDVLDFLGNIGYDIHEQVCHFCLFVLVRSELVKWNSARGRRMIKDVPLYITVTGRIAIEKLLYGITYISEAMLSSIQIDRTLCQGLRERVFDNPIWVADCISNASIALYVIGRIEWIESEAAARNNVDLGPYLLHKRLGERLAREASNILRADVAKTRRRWEDNVARLARLKPLYHDLKPLGGSA